MFWGLNLKPNRKYSQTTKKSFHISHAALDGASAEEDSINQIFLTSENEKFLICTLKKDKVEQVVLDLNFLEGDAICFQSIGSGNVTLSGYINEYPNENYEDSDASDEEGEDLDLTALLNGAKKNKKQKKADKKSSKEVAKNEDENEDEDDDDSDDEDFTLNSTALEEAKNDDDSTDNDDDDDENDDDDTDVGDDDDDDDGDDDESDDEEEVQQPKAKQRKVEKQKQNGDASKIVAQDKHKGKKEKKSKGQQQGTESNQKQQSQQSQPQQKAVERSLSGGVKIEDIKVGQGPEVKNGKRASVYYEGRLKTNNKVFDSLKTGAPFKFSVGRGEVIKGWDIGVNGMKVGGKRRIICPPHMAYGPRGSPPQIPPNSTLVFEVELKGVN